MPGTGNHDLLWLVVALAELAIVALLAAALLRRRASDDAALRAQLRIAHLRRLGATAEVAEWISHELGTPLASMVNNLGAARHLLAGCGAAGEEAAAAVSEALSDGERVAQVMARMRSIVRTEGPLLEPVDLNDVAREAIGLVRSARLGQGVAVKEELGGDLARVHGDRVQLLQVVLSLLVNAFEAASPSRGRSVTLRTVRRERSVQLLVVDSGAGICERDRPHLFEPFFTTQSGGIGVGLPMVRSIVEAHGGTVAAERPPSGAAFRVTLPAAPEATTAGGRPSAASAAGAV
jgi:signal transduction histidine kinase